MQEARLSGNDEGGYGPLTRRPLYLPPEDFPYTPGQLQALRDAYASAARGDSFDHHWPQVRDEARKCAKALGLLSMRRPDRNAWQRLNAAVRKGTVAKLLKSCPLDANALLYGAMCARVVTPAHDRQDYEVELSQLCRLGADEMKAALAAAKEKGSILWDIGRPKGGPFEDFATFLGGLYVNTTKRPLSESFTGPTVRFMRAALAPFPPEFKSKGLRSLIRRVKAKLESSEFESYKGMEPWLLREISARLNAGIPAKRISLQFRVPIEHIVNFRDGPDPHRAKT